MINLLKKMATVMPLQRVEDVLEDAHANSRLNQVMKVTRKHLNPTKKSTNHVTIKPNHHQTVVEEAVTVAAGEADAVAARVDVVVQAVVAAAIVVAVTADEVDIEAVDAVAAVVVKEVIVPLANKKSKTVINSA